MNGELRHGYTLFDLHNLARFAVHTAGRMATDYLDRYEIAWCAIAEKLYSADEWMPDHDLVYAGRSAIFASVTDDRHTHGVFKYTTFGNQHGRYSSPAFNTYWLDRRADGSPENRIVERDALDQIMPMLQPRHQRALLALAVYEDYQAAADAMGIKYQTFRAFISGARREFFEFWHEGETPAKQWGCDRRAGATRDVPKKATMRTTLMDRRRRLAERAA